MTSRNIMFPDSYCSDPVQGPAPVHVLQPQAEGPIWDRTACGIDVDGVLWNAHLGSTNCEACKAAVVERALS